MIAYILNRLNLINSPGDLKMRASETTQNGWLKCDGASYPTSYYPALFAEIGYTWGGSGANFNVPDFRGVVPRGWNNSATPDLYTDPNFSSRAARYAGGQTGDRVGSYQEDQLEDHFHDFGFPTGAGSLVAGANNAAGSTGNPIAPAKHGLETRMKNAYVMFVIKT